MTDEFIELSDCELVAIKAAAAVDGVDVEIYLAKLVHEEIEKFARRLKSSAPLH